MKWDWTSPHDKTSELVQVEKAAYRPANYIKFYCPACGSGDTSFGHQNGPEGQTKSDWSYLCHDCGLHGLSMREWREVQDWPVPRQDRKKGSEYLSKGRKYKIV